MKTLPIVLCALLLAGAACAEEVTPGKSVFGSHGFVEYIPGDLPLVIAVPHGGHLRPDHIPDRAHGVTTSDANTQELGRTIAAVMHAETGHRLHLIICHLHRSKLDANRSLDEAAEGNPIAAQAWHEHHGYIASACATAAKTHGAAFFIDLHGHSHPEPRIELGYLHDALDLADCTERLDQTAFGSAGSIAFVALRSGLRYTDLLRGPGSFGALLEQQGFPATPSPRMPVPTEPYFRGGFTVGRHCKAAQGIAGLQIEANRPRVRDTAENRLRFAHALVNTLKIYLPLHLGIKINQAKPAVEAQ